ncbi:hypothetical protein [Chloracidobacterium aggregatum]|uniref:Uncharacterized protein n=1 Tax=Chloracidobacterium sp. N TaxID=2821540 RepID=A0ABX8B5B3_9BACT|nr:hypothetical protein [Chloracidobacterium aggregatum]QUV86387.1 hypothetical protein J8C03_12125 [Chloracidobacterium sp. 2]QUV89182.1 hypothetical protein J8C07_15360 [Chloracidobacterium sp. S]QUV92013.1 hypothetical protein J8C04_13850 [Chloracidobacterium sp. A]QUV95287.1 hypothetical protein J8C05_14835 [Chloracidobacterium sp. N]
MRGIDEASIEREISMDVKFIYVRGSRLVIERKYNFLFEEVSVKIGAALLLAVVLVPILYYITTPIMVSFLRVDLSWLEPYLSLPFVLFLLMGGVVALLRTIITKKDARRTIFDKSKKIITFENERKGKIEIEKCYSMSDIKNVKVVVDSYGKLDIYLNSSTESIYVIGDTQPNAPIVFETSVENERKLELAHLIAELLGVPVIEKT